MHDQPGPALFLVPFEASEVGFVKFVIRLAGSRQSSYTLYGLYRRVTDLLLELFVDGI